MAVAPVRIQPEPVAAATPERIQVPRQSRLFPESESKILQFPAAARPVEPKPRSRRQAQQRSDSQAFLDFQPPAPHAPRTLKTSVEAVIYCDAPVATPIHRAVGFGLDFSVVMIAIGVFLVTFYLCGGEFPKFNTYVALGFGGAFLGVALFYGLLWVLTGSESAGARWTGLRYINFDGTPIDRRERAIRFAAACLSFFSAGLGVLWSLADEEGLTWHDHMSKTFPTIRA
jgi:Predicted membrane protein/domain